jgi:hypothetical protein
MRRRELMGDQGARLVRPPRQGLPKVARMDSRDNVSVAEILAKKGTTVQDVIDRQRNWGMPFQQAVDMFNGFTMSLWSTAWKTRPSADEPYTWLGNTGLPIGVIRLRVLHALPAAFGLADLRLTKENLFKTDLTGLTIREDAATGTVTVQGIDALDESHPVRRAAIAHIIPTITHPSYQKKPSRRGIPVNFSSIEKPIVLVPGQPPLPRTEAAVVLILMRVQVETNYPRPCCQAAKTVGVGGQTG